MEAFLNYAAKLAGRVVDFMLRKRSVAATFIRAGSLLILGALAGGWAVGVDYADAQRLVKLTVQTTDGLPVSVTLLVLALGVLLLSVGLVMGSWDWLREKKQTERRKAIVVELRGLHSSPDTSAVDADLGLPSGHRDACLVDFRPAAEGQLVDPDLALEKLSVVKNMVEAACGGRAREDITVALGGLAAVPCLFLAGMLFDDESNVVVFDWDRNRKAWRLTDDLDDGKRMRVLEPELTSPSCDEVVFAVSVSYPVDDVALTTTFGVVMPIVHLKSEEMLADRYWSFEKQQAIVVAFRDAVQTLMAQGVKRIHLILAAPSSLCIRMGMTYDRRLMPELVVYQYERTAQPPYPWGIRMPTHGFRAAAVERFTRDDIIRSGQQSL